MERYVEVVPLTKKGQIVLIRKTHEKKGVFRIPGGKVKPGSALSSVSAFNILQKLTGYSAKGIYQVGTYTDENQENPRYYHVYLALDCEVCVESKNDKRNTPDIRLMNLNDLLCAIEDPASFDETSKRSILLAVRALD